MSSEPKAAGTAAAVDDQPVGMLVARARAEGLQWNGESQLLTKRVLESSLEGEITDHLAYDEHDAKPYRWDLRRHATQSRITLAGPMPCCSGWRDVWCQGSPLQPDSATPLRSTSATFSA